MKKCAFLTMGDIGGLKCDDPMVYGPLADKGWQVNTLSWHGTGTDWQAYDAVVIRSTWDYQCHLEAFSNLLETIDAAGVRLENKIDLVKWNMNKSYLRDLEKKGISIVPTLWGRGLDVDQFPGFFREVRAWDTGSKDLVIKPRVSASAKDTFLISANADEDTFHGVASRFENREWMVQPFMESVVAEGEFSLFYFGGQLSHTILKQPKENDFRVQEEYGGQNRLIETPEKKLQARADQVISALSSIPLYARVDMVRFHQDFYLMELELIEPSLFFSMDPNSPERFAMAFDRYLS